MERNIFLIECIREPWNRDINHTALTRYYKPQNYKRFPEGSILAMNRLELVQGVKQVKHWRVLISPSRFGGAWSGITDFCRSLCHNEIKTMEIAVTPFNDEMKLDYKFPFTLEDNWLYSYRSLAPKHAEEILRPFEIFKIVRLATSREAESGEIPDFATLEFATLDGDGEDCYYGGIFPKMILPDAEYQAKLLALIQGDTEVERFHEIYHAFIKYAQTFERDGQLKKQMAIDWRTCNLKGNPFRGARSMESHPVEAGMVQASQLLQSYQPRNEGLVHDLKDLRSNVIIF